MVLARASGVRAPMARTHFGAQMKQAGGRTLRVSPEQVREANAERGVPLARATLKLTAELIEAFALTYLSHKYDSRKPTPQFHREMWADCANEDAPNVVEAAPRGHAKSTAITEAYGLAAMLFRQRDFVVIISNTVGQSVEFLRDLKAELTENDDLIRDFKIHKLVKDTEDDIIVQMSDGHKFRIVARGSEQKIRGLKWNKRRPNLVLGDDLEDDEQVANAERRGKFAKWFMRAVLPFGSDDCLFRIVGTIMHFDSLLAGLLKDDSWVGRKYKAHESFNSFANILWPEKFPEARLRALQAKFVAKGDQDGYSQELLNDPIADGFGFFRPDDLLPMEDFHHKQPMRKVCAWDFAISEKQKADYTVCVVLGINSSGQRFVLDVRRGRWPSDEIVEEMFSVQRAHDCEVHYAEAGQIEKTFAPFLYTAMRNRAEYFNVETRIPVLSKVARAASWRAATRARSVFYDQAASWWPDLLEEMKRFPKAEHDDQVDPQALLGMELEGLLSAATPAEAANEEYEDLMASQPEGRSSVTGY